MTILNLGTFTYSNVNTKRYINDVILACNSSIVEAQEMIRLVIACILALLYLSETSGECPRMEEVPVMYNKETFMCACN